jgi:hypothetical protein
MAGRHDEAGMTHYTPEQHRRIAEIYRRPDGQATPDERALELSLANQHEALARMIEYRDAKSTGRRIDHTPRN